MSPSADARAIIRAIDALTTQVRRLADAQTASGATPGDARTALTNCTHRDEDVLRATRRDGTGVLLSRAERGVLTRTEAGLLREYVEAEMRGGDTARAVAAGNKRHVQTIVPEIDRFAAELAKAQAAIARARALHKRNEHSGNCEHCSEHDYPNYAVPWPCPTARALDGSIEQPTTTAQQDGATL